jgi:hypothetical protein
MSRPLIPSRTSPCPSFDEPPITPLTLAEAPELALLALLDETLRIAGHALLAAQPALVGDPPAWRVTPELLAAKRLLRDATRLAAAIAHYRRSVLLALHHASDIDRDDNLPF